MRTIFLLILATSAAWSLTIEDVAAMPEIAKASAAAAAAQDAYVDAVIAVVNSWDIKPAPAIVLGPDPKRSDMEKATLVENYNALAAHMIPALRRFKESDAQEGNWKKQMLTEAFLIKKRRDEAIAGGAVHVDASPDKAKPKGKIKAKLADGTVIEE